MIPSNSTLLRIIRNVPAVEATPDYASGDLLGGKQELLNAVDRAGDSGRIVGVRVTCNAAIAGVDIDAVFFNADPVNTTFTENGPLAIDADDFGKVIEAVSLSTQIDFASNAGHISQPAAAPDIPFVLDGGTSLYCALVVRGAFNLADAADIGLRVAIARP